MHWLEYEKVWHEVYERTKPPSRVGKKPGKRKRMTSAEAKSAARVRQPLSEAAVPPSSYPGRISQDDYTGPSVSDAPSTPRSLSSELAADTVDEPSQQLLGEQAANGGLSMSFYSIGGEGRVSSQGQIASLPIADNYHRYDFEFKEIACQLCRWNRREV